MRSETVILQELDAASKADRVEDCIALCREGARLCSVPMVGGWSAFRINLGLRLLDDRRPPTPRDVEEALATYQELMARMPKDAMQERADACIGLGWSYYYWTRGDREDNLRRSVEAFTEALTWYTRKSDAHQWAGIKAAIAFVYSEMDAGDFRGTRLQAIKFNEEALQVLTAADYPDDFDDITGKIRDLKRQLGALSE